MTKKDALQKIEELKKFIEQEENKKPKEDRLFELLQLATSIKFDKDKYPNSTFGFAGDKFLWEYDSKKGYLWLSYYLIWSVFEKEYDMGYNDIQTFIKILVENHFNCKGVTPPISSLLSLLVVENHFNCKGVTRCQMNGKY